MSGHALPNSRSLLGCQYKDQERGEVLTVIIGELRSIGLIIARNDERIEASSKAKDGARPRDYDSVLVAVGFYYTEPFRYIHILSLGIRMTPLRKFIIFRFYMFVLKYGIH